MVAQSALLGTTSALGYNRLMPTIQRPDRVNIKVRKQAKDLAILIAAVEESEESKWKETDAWEQGIFTLAQSKRIKEKIDALSQEERAAIIAAGRASRTRSAKPDTKPTDTGEG